MQETKKRNNDLKLYISLADINSVLPKVIHNAVSHVLIVTGEGRRETAEEQGLYFWYL